MEHSTNSSKKTVSCKGIVDSPEESGWTAYFEDFVSDHKSDSSCSYGYGTNSLVSDAASNAAWKFPNNNQASGHISESGLDKKLKRRARGIMEDDALEDTASSPVNSPKKVSAFKHFDTNQGKKDDNINSSQEKGTNSGYYSELQRVERNEEGSNGIDNECTELKKRGLCLVPVSMLLNYLG